MSSVIPVEGLTDFHTHILPGMDDGSRSEEESLRMLRMSAEYGISSVVLTPHFYAEEDSLISFSRRRLRSLKKLADAGGLGIVPLHAGAEVAYFDGISAMEELGKLRIRSSKAILIEMPFRTWTRRIVDDIISINRRNGFQVVIAHIERHLGSFTDDTLDVLLSQGVMIQSNANFFINQKTRKRALHMLEQGMIHILGSDCHRSDVRVPNLGEACEVISERFGTGILRKIAERESNLLSTI